MTVKNKALPRNFYRTFDTEEEAKTFGEQLEAMLERGVVPQSLLDSMQDKKELSISPMLTTVILDYQNNAPCSTSESEQLTVMMDELVGYRIIDVTFDWAEQYIR